eukprot:6657110-Pyramimonas_sp.AAC.1
MCVFHSNTRSEHRHTSELTPRTPARTLRLGARGGPRADPQSPCTELRQMMTARRPGDVSQNIK